MAAVAHPQAFHRKPVGQQATSYSQPPFNAAVSGAQHAMNGAQRQQPYSNMATQQNFSHPQQYQPQQHQPQQQYAGQQQYTTQQQYGGQQQYSNQSQQPQYQQQQPSQSQYQHPGQSRRTLSNATSSTSSTSNPRMSTSYSSIRRSASSRSNASASPTSYVALMRKQKATVWCDRAQHQDPRILAAQRQAKMRAVMEVAGGQHQVRVQSSSGITGGGGSKIRHHGAPKAKDYNAGNLSGAGVPMRLSATEVDEVDSDDESRHQRGTSSRSSMGSANHFAGSYRGYEPSHSAVSPVESLTEEQTPMPGQYANQSDYFGQAGGNGGSGSSGEAEKQFGGIAGLPQVQKEEHVVSTDELRRRGSVDDRTMTLSAGRLFVANPDLSD